MTSVPLLAVANSDVRELARVELNTKLPDMNATPKAMARAVMASRSRLVSMSRRMKRIMVAHSPRDFIASMTDSGSGSSSVPMSRPSARKTTRSE